MRLRELLPNPSDYLIAMRLLSAPAVVVVVTLGAMMHVGNGVQSSFYVVWLKDIGIPATAIGTLIPILRDNGELKTNFGTYLLAAGGVVRTCCPTRPPPPPSDSPSVTNRARPQPATAASSSPRTRNDTMPPNPRICLAAPSWPGWLGRPG